MYKNATPIYPHDAQTIVNMMDLHFDPSDTSDEPFEVFEAGTGAGSLTIHIARALSSANPPLPPELREELPRSLLTRSPNRNFFVSGDRIPAKLLRRNISNIDWPDHDMLSQAKDYVSKRKAVLHTLDYKPLHTKTAQDLVRSFRKGVYLPHVDFHVGAISSYLVPRLVQRSGRPFLSRAVLDLPTAETEAAHVIPCLHPNGTLIIFSPSISQIGNFIKWSTTTNQPLKVDRVAELPTSTSGFYAVGENEGGRSWKVQTVQPKVYRADKTGREYKKDEGDNEREPVQVMRPKVGDSVCGGGFVAVFRKVRAGQSGTVAEVKKVLERDTEGSGLAPLESYLEKHLQDVKGQVEKDIEEEATAKEAKASKTGIEWDEVEDTEVKETEAKETEEAQVSEMVQETEEVPEFEEVKDVETNETEEANDIGEPNETENTGLETKETEAEQTEVGQDETKEDESQKKDEK